MFTKILTEMFVDFTYENQIEMCEKWYLSQQLMELNSDMESLELNEESDTAKGANNELEINKSQPGLRRSSRTKNNVHFSIPYVATRAKKTDKNTNLSAIEQYYLSKKVKRLPSTLETIYEEPKDINNEKQYMSVKKFKRVLKFEEENSVHQKQKRSKRRLMKAKKVTAYKRISSKKKISMEVLLRKLESVENVSED